LKHCVKRLAVDLGQLWPYRQKIRRLDVLCSGKKLKCVTMFKAAAANLPLKSPSKSKAKTYLLPRSTGTHLKPARLDRSGYNIEAIDPFPFVSSQPNLSVPSYAGPAAKVA
jgi:hypothetical protein